MNYEEKINELTERIEILEKRERKRIIKRRIEITFKIIKTITIIIVLFMAYNYINNTYIKPYKEKIDYINDKIDTVDNLINDRLNIFN